MENRTLSGCPIHYKFLNHVARDSGGHEKVLIFAARILL